MLKNFRFLMLALGLIAAVSSAHGAENGTAAITVTNSLKDIEIQLARVLKDHLNINANLSIRGDDSEDLVLKVLFNNNPETGYPQINAVIDARVITFDNEKNPVNQVISIASYAAITLMPDTDMQRLEWVNNWNRRSVPLTVYVAGDRIVATNKLLLTAKAPMTEGQFAAYFSNTVRYWPALVKDLKNSGLVE